jgi:dTDP-4-amino-4,6-dideoxygalactose transaminase
LVPGLISQTLDDDDVEVAREWLSKPESWHGYEVSEALASAFARWNGSLSGCAFLGGRVALSACLHALDLKPGDEVIVPGYTCVVVPNAIRFAGLRVVYSDIETETYGLDVNHLAAKLTERTRAVLIQHLYGLVCRDLEATLSFAKRYNLAVIEDCAHATGAQFKGRRVGNFGDVAFFSFERSKVLTTIIGGLAVTNRRDLAERLRQFWERAPGPSSEHVQRQLLNVPLDYYQSKSGSRWLSSEVIEAKYGAYRLVSTSEEEIRGIRPQHYGCRMPDPIAALGLNQLRKLDAYNRSRRDNAVRWERWCEANGYAKPVVVADSEPVFLRYPVIVEPEKKRSRAWALAELGVELGVWFVSQVHPGPEVVTACPTAEEAVRRCVNFPCLFP